MATRASRLIVTGIFASAVVTNFARSNDLIASGVGCTFGSTPGTLTLLSTINESSTETSKLFCKAKVLIIVNDATGSGFIVIGNSRFLTVLPGIKIGSFEISCSYVPSTFPLKLNDDFMV